MKFSVIIAMYNISSYIEECVESLIGQSYGDFEAILVDDFSSDDTATRAKQAIANDNRFALCSLKENSGQSIARNKALDMAKGQYVLFLDGDDYFELDALEKLANRLDAQNLDCLYYSARPYYESSEARKRMHESYADRESFDGVATGRQLFTFFEQHNQFYPHGALQVVRRSIIEDNKIRLVPGIIHEDILYTFQILINSKRSSFLNDAIYIRRIRCGSTMNSQRRTIANIAGHLLCTKYMENWLYENLDSLDDDFAAAVSMRIAAYRNLCVRDWVTDIPSDEKGEFLDSLSCEDKQDFFIRVLGPGLEFLRNENCIHSTKAFRIGDMLLKGPRLVKAAICQKNG